MTVVQAISASSALNRGSIIHGVAHGAQYSDVTERYAADKFISNGTVVMICGDVTVTDSLEGSTITPTDTVTVGRNLSRSGSLSISRLALSGNVRGTVTTAPQSNITSLGTLTALTVDKIQLNGNTIF